MTKKWTGDDIDKLAGLLREGLSASKIAPHFGVSRNAIIGKVHRHLSHVGFKTPGNKDRKRPTQSPTPPTQAWLQSPRRAREKRPPAPVLTVFECRSIPMMELRAMECRWPVNDAAVGEQHLFCGNKADGSYCPGHAPLGVGYGTRSEQMADQRNRPSFRSAA